jgi:hypothetical protein
VVIVIEFGLSPMKNRILIFSIATAIILPLSGCFLIGDTRPEIKGPYTVTVNNDFCGYSFEFLGTYHFDGPRVYSSSYDKQPTAHDWTSYLGLFTKWRTSQTLSKWVGPGDSTGYYSWCPAGFEVGAHNKRYSFQKSVETLENILNFKKDKISGLERSKIILDGIGADQIVYYCKEANSDYLQWHREIYFDHNNSIWDIKASCDNDMQDIISADFEHVLSTIKLLK